MSRSTNRPMNQTNVKLSEIKSIEVTCVVDVFSR